jgi:tropinone reductase I
MEMQTWRLDGDRAVVTGGSKGIGRAVVEELLGLGAEVLSVALDRGEDAPGLSQVEADVGTAEGRAAVMAALPPYWDAIHILVNNAGMNVRKPTVDYSLDEYESVQRTNATSMFELSRALHSRLRASGRGSIVNISSIAGLMSVGSSAAYAMSKAAAAHLARYLAVEWAAEGIRVNAIAPGWTATPLTGRIQDNENAMRVIAGRTPMGRMAEAEEIARAVAFLCLPAASYVSGAVIPVDGAMSAYCMDITGALNS